MQPSDVEALKSFISAGGTIAVLVYMVRYFQSKLDKKDEQIAAKDTIIVNMVEKQSTRDVIVSGMLERIAASLDRVERRMDQDNFSHSGPHRRSDLTGGGT